MIRFTKSLKMKIGGTLRLAVKSQFSNNLPVPISLAQDDSKKRLSSAFTHY
jgi:hypothetical protein